MKVLNLGWGVQSWTLAAMVALGELEPIDFVIHADTRWEREATYDFARTWTPWLEQRGLRVVTVQPIPDKVGLAHIPTFTGEKGQTKRQCTGHWKIEPIRRFISEELGKRKIVKKPNTVEQWIGISQDEWHRAKDAEVQYVKHRFPLLELEMTRLDCERWLTDHGLPIPSKSSCAFCPLHNRLAWQEMKRAGGKDWATAVWADEQIRNALPPEPMYIHPARLPLAEAVQIPEDHGFKQTGLFDDECDSGHCFL